MWTAFVALARVERGQLVAQLSDRAAYGSDQEATLAVRQLIRMPRPPLESLVTAAATPSRPVAEEAQLAISDLLRRWQRQLKAGRKVGQVVDQLHTLAESLDHHADAFSPRDFPWLAKTTEKIVQLANKASPGADVALAVHCDSLLARASQSNPPAAAVDRQPVIVAQRPAAATAPDDDRPMSNLGRASAVTPGDGSSASQVPDSVFSPPPASALESLLPTDASEDDGAAEFIRNAARPNSSGVNWSPCWLPPALATASANSSPLLFRHRGPLAIRIDAPSQAAESKNVVSTPTNRWESLESRTLLERWSTARGAEALELQHVLQRRGFGCPSADLVQPLLSGVVADRVRLVHDIMGMPGVDAKTWLMLLADDPDAGVRFAAVSVMATSSDPELIEKAWQVALYDRDPRVASLAERLRSRRADAERR